MPGGNNVAKEMIAYCGLVCTGCPAYQATQSNDRNKIEETARLWSTQYGHDIKAADVWCEGCLVDGKKCAHCAECEIRACARKKQIENCAHCNEFICDTLFLFHKLVPEAAETLQKVRQSKLGS
jgi:hypothetical protein